MTLALLQPCLEDLAVPGIKPSVAEEWADIWWAFWGRSLSGRDRGIWGHSG